MTEAERIGVLITVIELLGCETHKRVWLSSFCSESSTERLKSSDKKERDFLLGQERKK
jgi:hypothetical protein